MGFEKIACCYHKLTAYFIQYALLVINIVFGLITFIGLFIIKWEFIPILCKFLYIVCILIYLFSIVCISSIIYFRRKKTLHTKNNRPCIKLSIVNIVLNIIGVLFSIICFIVIWINYDRKKKYYIDGKKAISGWNRFFMFVTQGGNFRGMSFLFFLWISILIRLIKKTNGAYIENENKVQTVANTSTISNSNEVKISTGVNESNIK